jgi:hypothetical protein
MQANTGSPVNSHKALEGIHSLPFCWEWTYDPTSSCLVGTEAEREIAVGNEYVVDEVAGKKVDKKVVDKRVVDKRVVDKRVVDRKVVDAEIAAGT